MKEEYKTRIQTAEGVDVTERINSGRTEFFTHKEDAISHANQRRSYHYPLLNSKHEHIGFGVPK